MAKQNRRERLRVWLERQAQPQADGNYLIRIPWLRMVLEIDEKTKDRWISFLLAYRRYGLLAALAYLFISNGQPWSMT